MQRDLDSLCDVSGMNDLLYLLVLVLVETILLPVLPDVLYSLNNVRLSIVASQPSDIDRSKPQNQKGEKKEKKKDEPPEVTSCVYMFPNGDKYEGECIPTENGSIERTGRGVHIGSNGVIYQGSWEADRMSGVGKLLHPTGASYEGDFVNNQFHGVGKYVWPDTSFYQGQFVENRMEGDGEFTDTEGQVWTGMFRYKAAPGLKFKLAMC